MATLPYLLVATLELFEVRQLPMEL